VEMCKNFLTFVIPYKRLSAQANRDLKVKIVIFIQCGPCFINGPKFPKISLVENFYIAKGHLVFVTFIHFMYISSKGVCGKNFGPNVF